MSYNVPLLPPNLNKTTLFGGGFIGFFFLVPQRSSSHIFINGHQLSSITQFSVYFTCTRKWRKIEWTLPNLQSGIELRTCSIVKRYGNRYATFVLYLEINDYKTLSEAKNSSAQVWAHMHEHSTKLDAENKSPKNKMNFC